MLPPDKAIGIMENIKGNLNNFRKWFCWLAIVAPSIATADCIMKCSPN
jgi:hypothetical protein